MSKPTWVNRNTRDLPKDLGADYFKKFRPAKGPVYHDRHVEQVERNPFDNDDYERNPYED